MVKLNVEFIISSANIIRIPVCWNKKINMQNIMFLYNVRTVLFLKPNLLWKGSEVRDGWWGRELSHMRDQCEVSAEKTTRMKWQVEPASWKNRNSETGDTGCMWAESWNMCLREQICVCDLIQYEAWVWNIVRLQRVQLKQAIFLVNANRWLPHNQIKNLFTRKPEVGCVFKSQSLRNLAHKPDLCSCS